MDERQEKFWDPVTSRWDSPYKMKPRRLLLPLDDTRRWDRRETDEAWLDEKVRCVEAIAWRSTEVHVRSNIQSHLGACGAYGGSGRTVEYSTLDRITCAECQSILAADLLVSEDVVVVL